MEVVALAQTAKCSRGNFSVMRHPLEPRHFFSSTHDEGNHLPPPPPSHTYRERENHSLVQLSPSGLASATSILIAGREAWHGM